MNITKNESGNVALAAVAIVAGLVIGFAAGKAMDNNKKTTSTASVPTSATKAADLRSNLVMMGVEHMIYTDQAVDGALDSSPNASATAAALYANGNDIGAAVGSIYGKSAETTFDSVWKLHLDQFVAYAVADSKGDAAGKTTALNTIQTGYTKPLAQYLAKANPNLPEATLESALGDHVAMTATMIDDHVQGKYADEAAELKMANQHIAGIFSTLAGGIVKQYPAKF
jgi:tartrate dehydratase beta subunit/fumarate hydratase class I family protein